MVTQPLIEKALAWTSEVLGLHYEPTPRRRIEAPQAETRNRLERRQTDGGYRADKAEKAAAFGLPFCIAVLSGSINARRRYR